MSSSPRLAPLFTLFAASILSASADWSWRIPDRVFKGLELGQRVTVDRASKLLDNGFKAPADSQAAASTFRAAAGEWHRFSTEYLTMAPEEMLSAASFLEAYSYHQARDFGKAIELYNDTIELYPDSDAAGSALYHRGQLRISNGQLEKGYADYRELVDTETYAKFPLRFNALMTLADVAANNGHIEEAIDAWRIVAEEGKGIVWEPPRNAEWNLWIIRICTSFRDAYASAQPDDDASPSTRLKRFQNFNAQVWSQVGGNRRTWGPRYFAKHLKGAKDWNAAVDAYLSEFGKWADAEETALYKALGDDWVFDNYMIDKTLRRSKTEALALVETLAGKVRALTDAKVRASRAHALIGRYKSLGQIDRAFGMLDLLPDKHDRDWTEIHLWEDKGAWAKVIELLAPFEDSDDPKEAASTKRYHANICKTKTGQFDEAIRLYTEAPDPPSTLWLIAECYRASNRKPQAQGVLDEICSVFPNDAAKAMMTKAGWYKADGDKKRAIGCYRRVLTHQDWKKTQYASAAHQELERLGVATGGGLIHEVH